MARKPSSRSLLGAHIRSEVIPKEMTVTEAAKRLGIGRPALSNLLNGNAALSPEMLLRLETTFGADRQRLLDLQAREDDQQRRESARAVPVSAYVPSFLIIKARQIEDWADKVLDARSDLPVLLRKLVHSTGRELRQVDFPGYDNAQRKGWDGWIDADAATPWIPAGPSGWEFGTDERPERKANDDYAARLTAVPAAERSLTTLVFVTPRNWTGKAKWVKGKNASGQWKGVRAFDASDLEQWLETSVSAQVWLAEKLNVPTEGFKTLEQCWQEWASVSEPPMSADVFAPSVSAHRETLEKWLAQPPERPFVVAADSRDEALAFLSRLFLSDAVPKLTGDLPVVFAQPLPLKQLASASSPFIPIVSTDEAERELATACRRLHCIVVRPRNAINSEPDIALELLRHEAFEKALATMNIQGDRVELLARESGYSPTILRRRLSIIDVIRTPAWARNAEIARQLIPMALIGAWHAHSAADCEILSRLAGRPYPQIEEAVVQMRTFDDSPVWSVGKYRGVASKLDALFEISGFVTEKHLLDFVELAKYILSESDPALELPEDQRWMAGAYGKVRNHSAALRQGVCETLVILAVHANNLFRARLGVDMESRVSMLIRELLTPLTLEKLLSHDHDLPRYAEAAPDTVLTIVEADLRQPEPVLLGLLKPADSGVFGRCLRTSLLWALEVLAWKAENLSRVSAALARLSLITINDNWMNKPIASLQAIYRCWMPQTAAPLDTRIKALEILVRKFPVIGWQICVDQFSRGSRVGTYSYRPHWRTDASGAGQVLPLGEIRAFARKALDLTIGWLHHDSQTLGDLVESFDGMTHEDQTAVWDLIEIWSETESNEHAKATLRERIRRCTFTRRGRKRDLNETTRDRARKASAKLTPRNLIIRHGWLFAKHWVEESAEELEDEDLAHSKRGERIHQQRLTAMTEIWIDRGLDGIMLLLQGSGAPGVIGHYVGLCVSDSEEASKVISALLAIPSDSAGKTDGCLHGFIHALQSDVRSTILTTIAHATDAGAAARLFRCAPFCGATWRLLDTQSQEVRANYWRTVVPQWTGLSEVELNEVIDRLLDVQRPRAGFHVVQMDLKRIETSRLKLLMRSLPGGTEPDDSLRPDGHYISEALTELNGRAGVTRDEMAHLEFIYLRALDHSDHGIPNLEQQITESPAMFAQIVAMAYRRSDDGEDPPEWSVQDPEQRSAVALTAHQLLERIQRIPGSKKGLVDADALLQWLTESRRLCAEHARAGIGDQRIGILLAHAPAEPGGSVWPCRAVCEAMEAAASEDIGRGLHVGVYNGRGIHSRGEGGNQERELAAKYRKWALETASDYPYVSSVLGRIALSYERDAEREDSEARVNRRLRY